MCVRHHVMAPQIFRPRCGSMQIRVYLDHSTVGVDAGDVFGVAIKMNL